MSCVSQENSSLVEDLKAKAAELEKLKLKNFQLEQQIYNVTQHHETSQRSALAIDISPVSHHSLQ